MRLAEITPSHQMKLNMTKWKSMEDVQDYLESEGYDILGEGAYSEAWGKPGSNTVIKLSKEEDVCWLEYAKWVKSQPYNKHLPKIYSLRTYDVGGEALFISRMERLDEVKDYFKYIDNMIGKEPNPTKVGEMLWVKMLGWDDVDELLTFDNVLRPLSRSVLLKSPKFKGMNGRQLAAKLLKNFSKSKLAVTVNKVRRDLHNNKCQEDLHQGNIMRRKDGTIVIIDPIAAGYTSSDW